MLALVRRRALMVLLTAVAVAVLAYLLASLRPVTYTASSVLIVPSGAGGSGPGQANEALRLASTYAELVPRDGDVLLAVASALQVPVSTVREDLTVSPLGGTALLRVSYTALDRDAAVLGSRTAAQAVVNGVATSDTVPRGSVRLVGLAEGDDVIVSGGVTPVTVPIGIVLGLALGGVLAVAAERANRRIDAEDQVASVLDVPVLDLDTATLARREALVRRWRDASPAGVPTLVGVAGADAAYVDVVDACHRIADGLPRDRVVVAERGDQRLSAAAGAVVLVPAGAPGSGEPNEEIASRAHVMALLVPMSVQRTAVRRTVSDLLTYGSRQPGFVLLTRAARPMGQRGRRPEPSRPRHEETTSEPVASAS